MHDPSPDTPHTPVDRIWSQPPNQPKPTPADPRLHDLVHDIDAAWDLPIPFALASQPPRGLQPRVEFTPKPMHPAMRGLFTDAVLAKTMHLFAIVTGIPCGCGSCPCPICTPGGVR